MSMLFLLLNKLASEVHTEAFTLVYIYLALIMIPCDELGKASLCQTEVLHINYTCLNHALAVIRCAGVLPDA
jgi:hypothetical protein